MGASASADRTIPLAQAPTKPQISDNTGLFRLRGHNPPRVTLHFTLHPATTDRCRLIVLMISGSACPGRPTGSARCFWRFLGDCGFPAKALFRQKGRRSPGILHHAVLSPYHSHPEAARRISPYERAGRVSRIVKDSKWSSTSRIFVLGGFVLVGVIATFLETIPKKS